MREPGWDSVGTISGCRSYARRTGREGSELEAVDVGRRINVGSEGADEVKGPRVKAEGDPQQRTVLAVVVYWTCRVRAELSAVDVAHLCQTLDGG